MYFHFQEKISSERLAHEKEIEKLQQEIALVKELAVPELNVDIPVENKLNESNSSNNIHDDDEMVSLSIIILKSFFVFFKI